jgi:hypothetical protein
VRYLRTKVSARVTHTARSLIVRAARFGRAAGHYLLLLYLPALSLRNTELCILWAEPGKSAVLREIIVTIELIILIEGGYGVTARD